MRTFWVIWLMKKAANTGSTPLFLVASLITVILAPLWIIPALLLAIYDLAEAVVSYIKH